MKTKFKFMFLLILASFAFFPLLVLAQDEVISNDEFVSFLLASIGGAKGLSTLALVGVSIQIIIKFLQTEIVDNWFSKKSGKIKLVIVTGMSVIGGVLSLMTVEGLSFSAAALHSSTLAAAMVFIHQVIKQFSAKA